MIHSRLDFQIKKTLLFLTGFAILIVILFPLAWLLINAIKTNAEAQKIPPEWIPNEFTLEPLLNVVLDLDGYATHWGTYFLNTIFVTIASIFLLNSKINMLSLLGIFLVISGVCLVITYGK